jgi:8-oxo-dGTP pyrophosphatase MutT (NUDIX family)/L-ascorbate metabolism protein UlaG (beta-lactamase superfamily)
VDLGLGSFSGPLGAGLPPADILFVSHTHTDHTISLDEFRRYAALTGSHPYVLATETTWSSFSEFHRQPFRFVAVEPGKHYDIGGARFHILDSAAHWPGCVNGVLEAEGKRIGIFLDRKRWEPSDAEYIENLAIAVVPFNEIHPLAEKTGHVSAAETLPFFRGLKRQPQLIVALHYGADDPVVYQQGTLASVLAGLAPDLNVRVAWAGMTIDTDFLEPRNPVAELVESDCAGVRPRVFAVAAREKRVIHDLGMLHASVLLAVRVETGKILVYERGLGQMFPGLWDLPGGHCQPEDIPDTGTAAFREFDEEVLLRAGTLRVAGDTAWLEKLSDNFALRSSDAHNRELTTVWGVAPPPGLDVAVTDSDDHGVAQGVLKTSQFTLPELMHALEHNASSLADGLVRFLVHYRDNPVFRSGVDSFVGQT